MYKIDIYEDKNGKSEIKEYIKKLKQNNNKDSRIKLSKVLSCIIKLKEYGLSIGKPYIKHIKNELWELRPLRDRIIFANLENNNFVLLNIFIKTTRRTPRREIDKAKRLLEDYKKRSEKNGL